jgi:peptidoglycan/xylan/chitin deacetylase (PgdA/CDA1 family)
MNSRSALILFILTVGVMLFLAAPGWSYAIAVLLFLSINAYGSVNVNSQFYITTLFRGSSQKKSIALTFDDGPSPGSTEKILDILDKHQVKATFFCIGKNIKGNPDLLKSIHDRGHLIGNHSFYHGSLFDLQPAWRMRTELTNTDSVIFEALGQRPRYFRPPYGVTNPMLAYAIKQTGHLTIGWSLRSLDTVINDQQKLLHRIVRSIKAGDILLMHDRCDVTVEILPELLDHIVRSGLTVERLDKMIGERAYV